MKQSRFIAPYKGSKTTFPQTRRKSGVYLIKENGKLVYIGYSETDLYRTMYRHFETWNHQGQRVNTYSAKMNRNNYTVRVILCTPAQARRLEKILIKKHEPRDNDVMYNDYQMDQWDEYTKKQYEAAAVSNLPDLF